MCERILPRHLAVFFNKTDNKMGREKHIEYLSDNFFDTSIQTNGSNLRCIKSIIKRNRFYVNVIYNR